jgi:hypothetical protein
VQESSRHGPTKQYCRTGVVALPGLLDIASLLLCPNYLTLAWDIANALIHEKKPLLLTAMMHNLNSGRRFW